VPLLLRRVHRGKWLPGAGEGQRPDDEVAAEDFEDPDNEISVWEVDAERSNLNRVVAAIAGRRDHLSDLHYVLFDSVLVTNLAINIANGDGDTRDHYANVTWHRNLINASPPQILTLVPAIKALKPGDPATRLRREKDVLPLLKQAVMDGWMRAEDLSPNLQRRLVH